MNGEKELIWTTIKTDIVIYVPNSNPQLFGIKTLTLLLSWYLLITKSACGSMDRASTCGAEAQVSIGGFFDCAHLSLLHF